MGGASQVSNGESKGEGHESGTCSHESYEGGTESQGKKSSANEGQQKSGVARRTVVYAAGTLWPRCSWGIQLRLRLSLQELGGGVKSSRRTEYKSNWKDFGSCRYGCCECCAPWARSIFLSNV